MSAQSSSISRLNKKMQNSAKTYPVVDVIDESDSDFEPNASSRWDLESRNKLTKSLHKRVLDITHQKKENKKAKVECSLFINKSESGQKLCVEEHPVFMDLTEGDDIFEVNSEDFLSVSQMNEFVVNDPFAQNKDKPKPKTNTELDDFQFTQYCGNSQFMDQIETAISKIQKVSKKRALKESGQQKGARSQRSRQQPSQVTDEAVFDTTFNDSLAELMNSSQYRREINEGFDNVEKSICAMGNVSDEFNLSAINQSIREPCPAPSEGFVKTQIADALEKTFRSTEIMKKVIKHAAESVNLNKDQIEWADDGVISTAITNISRDTSISKLIREALLKNVNRTLTQTTLQNETIMEVTNAQGFVSYGGFFDLPDRVKDLIRVYKGINELYDWQEECLTLPAIKSRRNLVYALPTSGGKTLVAEILILREVLCRRKNAIFILPYVAIVQEKVWAMSPFAVGMEFLVEEYAAGKGNYPPRQRRRKNSVYICTIEKALGLINSLIETQRMHEIGIVVVDELHLLGDGSRGTRLEILLTKIKMLQHHIQIIGMSATIGNVEEICSFLHADVYSKDFRPVELVEFIKCESEIARVNKSAKNADDLLIFERRVDYYKNTPNMDKIDPDHLGGLVSDVIPDASCLIFCKTRINCENVAKLLCKVFKRDIVKHRRKDKDHIKRLLKDEVGSLCEILAQTISFGVAYHHSGLTTEERRIIEDAFRQGIISVICCTSTLAAGVNLPAKRVIIRNPYVGREFINLSRYKQMIGRAGRAGFEEVGESIMICTPQELPKVREVLLSPMDIVLSSMAEDNCDGIQNFLLSCVSLNLAASTKDLHTLVSKTLMAVQAQRLDIDVTSSPFSTANAIGNDQKKTIVNIDNRTPLEISKLGLAAIKGGLELSRAHILYEDLLKAQSCLVLFTGLHLMYLVTPYAISEQVKPSSSLYYSLYIQLDEKELQTAKALGFSEAVAGKLLGNRKITEISERVMNRFYVTLMLNDLWNGKSVYEVSLKYETNRGLIQNLMTSAATFASNVYHFCAEFDEFWAFSLLLKGMSDRLSHCCVKELIPLMKLPSVKQNRAKQLFNAGYKTLQSVARADPEQLMQQIEFMTRKLANQLIAAAKMILLEKVENLREEADDVLEGIQFN